MSLSKIQLELVLKRKEFKQLLNLDITPLYGQRILVTGAAGSIGRCLVEKLRKHSQIDVLPTDIVNTDTFLDVTDPSSIQKCLMDYQPHCIVNLAGAKHAPQGEHETLHTLRVNTLGTQYLIDAMPKGCKFVLASTCKANNPEVVYGATKLIAERMALNARGSVARYFNIIESSGNVFEIWQQLPHQAPIEVAPTCERYFISMAEAVGLTLFTMMSKPGRYIVNTGPLITIGEVAERLYPNRSKKIIAPRRGDRLRERFLSTSERVVGYHCDMAIIQVKSIHDLESMEDGDKNG